MSMSGKKVLTQVLMKGASTFTFGDEICVGILSHITDKKLEKWKNAMFFSGSLSSRGMQTKTGNWKGPMYIVFLPFY